MVSSPGVLETSDQGDREAFRKAKILYKSCMNESESFLVPLILLFNTKCTKYQCTFKQKSNQYLSNLHGLAWKANLQVGEGALVRR